MPADGKPAKKRPPRKKPVTGTTSAAGRRLSFPASTPKTASRESDAIELHAVYTALFSGWYCQ
jgi:hypothetical protein